MNTEKMLVTKALNELNLLDARINRAINDAGFVAAAKTVEKKVTPGVTKEDYITSAQASYQSVLDLVARRSKIKAAIVASNAVTMVEVNGESMTVSEAIELKSSIEYEIKLLRQMRKQFDAAKDSANRANLLMEERIDKYIETMLGKEAKAKKEDYTEMIEPIRVANEYSLVDPINVEDKIKMLHERIEGFTSEVDSVLQISNCTTWIEI